MSHDEKDVPDFLSRAIEIAARAHAGQEDKGGSPYILHPIRVMLKTGSETERICAILHDVLEDTDVSNTALLQEGFPEEILSVLDCVTTRQGETYDDFIDRILENETACRVKLADLADNMDLSRIPNPTDKDRQRLAKYQDAAKRITNRLFSSESSEGKAKKRIRYRFDGRLMDDDTILAYRLYAGMHVLYVSPEGFAAACSEGIVETGSSGESEGLQYADILRDRGNTAHYRMKYALENNTLDFLREELDSINDLPDVITFEYLLDKLLLATIVFKVKCFKINVEIREEMKRPRFDSEYASLKHASRSYSAMLDYICGYVDRRYMNSRNLLRKVHDENERRSKIKGKKFILNFKSDETA